MISLAFLTAVDYGAYMLTLKTLANAYQWNGHKQAALYSILHLIGAGEWPHDVSHKKCDLALHRLNLGYQQSLMVDNSRKQKSQSVF